MKKQRILCLFLLCALLLGAAACGKTPEQAAPETAAAVKAYLASIVSQRIRPMLKEWRK